MLKITGLDKVRKKLQNLEKKAQALDGTHNVPLDELLAPAFLSKYTRFPNVTKMFEAGGFKIETQEDITAIPDDKWDEFIRSVSPFSDWQDMLGKATEEWTASELGF